MSSEWINVKEQPPVEGELVLTINNSSNSLYKEYKLDYIVPFPQEVVENRYIWACRLEDEYARVTHWMPLPKPPS